MEPILYISEDRHTLLRCFLWIKMRVLYEMLCDVLIPQVSPCLCLGGFVIQRAERCRRLPTLVIRFPSLTPRNPKQPEPQGYCEASSRSHSQWHCTRRHRKETDLPNGLRPDQWVISDQALDVSVVGKPGAPLALHCQWCSQICRSGGE